VLRSDAETRWSALFLSPIIPYCLATSQPPFDLGGTGEALGRRDKRRRRCGNHHEGGTHRHQPCASSPFSISQRRAFASPQQPKSIRRIEPARSKAVTGRCRRFNHHLPYRDCTSFLFRPDRTEPSALCRSVWGSRWPAGLGRFTQKKKARSAQRCWESRYLSPSPVRRSGTGRMGKENVVSRFSNPARQ
jgi:hypothetical protein